MSDVANNRISGIWSGGAKAKILAPFLTAGYPSLDATVALLRDFERRGVRLCEIGIPFSDPIADGPVIQASFTETLEKGLKLSQVFAAIRQYREQGGQLALACMISYSIVFRHGVKQFLADAKSAGFDGMIVPDLPLEEAKTFEPLASSAGLANIMLIAPTTPAERRVEIARHSRGFIYYMSIAGITGERDRLPEATISAVQELKRETATPVCVGFGISNAATVASICQVADGAIVGSAIVRRITEAKAKPLAEIVGHVGAFVGELLKGVE